jgi:hypothetical protein
MDIEKDTKLIRVERYIFRKIATWQVVLKRDSLNHCNLTCKICKVICYKKKKKPIIIACDLKKNHRCLILRNPKIQCANRLVILHVILALNAPSILQCIKIYIPYNV